MRDNLKSKAVAERVKRGGGPRVVLAQHRLSDLERPAKRHYRVVQPARPAKDIWKKKKKKKKEGKEKREICNERIENETPFLSQQINDSTKTHTTSVITTK